MKRSKLGKSTEEKEGVANNNNNSEFNKLTVDLIISIFIRCPVKTLSMLRCASKSWNDFITSPLFVHSHLQQSMENAQLLFVEHKYSRRAERCRLRFVSVNTDVMGEKDELYTVSVPDHQFSCAQWIVCSGLVCKTTDYGIYLCNPALQQLFALPKYSPSGFPGPDDIGFGYLHSKKEYKVVHFFYSGPAHHLWDLQLANLRCEVFTLNGVGDISNRWKEIVETPPCHPCYPGRVINECMYWLAQMDLRTNLDRIVSFDFENENFLTISRPSTFETLSGLDMAMMDLKGMLCLPDMHRFRKTSILDLWILKDKISCIWVKEYSINLVNFGPESITPIFGTWNLEIIFTHSDMVVFYDLKRKCFRRVKGHPTTVFGIYQKCLFSLGST